MYRVLVLRSIEPNRLEESINKFFGENDKITVVSAQSHFDHQGILVYVLTYQVDVRGVGPAFDPADPLAIVADPASVIPEGFDLEREVEDYERRFIMAALKRTKGNRTEAARWLGISFRSLRFRLSKLGINYAETSPKSDDPAAEKVSVTVSHDSSGGFKF